MKKLNKKGFTLIELLAVIVVLAILMLVAVQNIFPMIANARANSFVSTVENIRDAANNKYVSDLLKDPRRDEKCYSVKTLVAQSYVSVDDTNIIGAVCVKEGAGNNAFKILVYDFNNRYVYTTGWKNGASTDVATASITSSASLKDNTDMYFYDVSDWVNTITEKADLAALFPQAAADGTQSFVKVGGGAFTKVDDGAGMLPCFGGSNDSAITKCVTAVSIHVNK